MPAGIDITGKRFGILTVESLVKSPKSHGRRWLCRCDCGNSTERYANDLRSGKSKHCGCQKASSSKRIDIKGQVFGRLTAIEDVGSKDGARIWRCLCDCGNTTVLKVSRLRSGHVKSCGCYRKDFQQQESHSRWKGGCNNRGSLAWAGNRISALNAASERLGYCRINLTPPQLVDLYKKAKKKCQICGVPQAELDYSLHIDHCHSTGDFRGLLCQNCNRGIGHFSDDPELLRNAAKYLAHHIDAEPAPSLKEPTQ